MKIWEVELSALGGDLGEKLVRASDYLEAVEKVKNAALKERGKWTGLDDEEKKTLWVKSVELYCETDVGE